MTTKKGNHILVKNAVRPCMENPGYAYAYTATQKNYYLLQYLQSSFSTWQKPVVVFLIQQLRSIYCYLVAQMANIRLTD